MTAMTATLDELIRRTLPVTGGEEFPAADALSVVIALGQLAILALTVRALGADGLVRPKRRGFSPPPGCMSGRSAMPTRMS